MSKKVIPHLISIAIAYFTPVVSAQTTIGEASGESVVAISPKKAVPEVKTAKIDSERFELGAYLGMLSIEDFDTVSVYGISLNYHINSRFLLAFNYGQSDEAESSFEEVLDADFLANREDGFQYTSISGGYKLFDGRSYLSKRRKYNSHIYVLTGVENVEFGGESNMGLVLGANYKVVFTDWLTADLAFKNHIVQREFLDEDKTTQNLEWVIGVNALF